ncbi:NACHT domain-containing protein [Amycolatopsis benzoatilytica]|uniref:NACHT domain-containing protein n=1 Tax=Amycolatopsis benzoatilytica TaxID=346045 RepID=UPI00037AE8AB|nr:hypothetical protein [Amycolatopsis benzoatilytica]
MAADLEQLGPIGFQDLAGALCVASFGPGIQVMGSGRDGGRDLYHRGPLVWKGNDGQPNEEWDGYTVFQVKHKKSLEVRPADNARWLQGQIRSELKEWADSTSGRDPVPDYLVFITNVPLTPTPGSGGHDQTLKDIDNFIANLNDDSRDVGSGDDRQARYRRLSRIREFRIWDANQIQTLLDVHVDVRLAFPGFFTAADAFAHMSELTGYVPKNQLEPALRAHARTTLMGESSVYFDEAGSGDVTGMPLHEVVIDLPITLPDEPASGSVIRYVLDRGERMLKPSLTTFKGPRHLVIAGAPGNGKTTISKFLAQAYRAASLANGDNLSVDHRQVIAGAEAALGRFQRNLPRHPRWAMRIDLAQYAEDHGFSDGSTLIGYIAEKVSSRSDLGSIRGSSVLWWLQRWPSFLILDGLDEVTEPRVRKWVIARVVEFVTGADGDDCDVFVVMTTRPMGYVENIAPTQFERLDLDYLSADEAIRYGEMATRARLRADLDRTERIVRQLEIAAHDDSFQLLLRTPLQVLIMTIIIGNAGHLAPDRYSLFWGYYDTVLRREREKTTSVRAILQNYSQHIQRLHEQVGFELQARSEAADRSFAALTRHELHSITWQILHDAGFKPSDADAELLDKILTTATHRLVLIVPRGDEGYGFDVRSLQELMAARYLTTGTDDAVLARLRISAASPHWRNTVIFAAGYWFSEPQDHRHQAIVELVETVDDDAGQRLGNIVPVGPRLALDLIDDGMARAWPRPRDRLVRHALQVLHEPRPQDLTAIARSLIRIADTGDGQQRTVEDGLREAQTISLTARDTTHALQDLVPSVVKEIGARARINGLATVRSRTGAAPLAPPLDGWDDFEAEIETAPVADPLLANIRLAAGAVLAFKAGATQGGIYAPWVIAVLAYPDGAAIFETALQHVVPHEPALVAELRDNVLPAVHRAAIGDRLRHRRSD